jgi:hypothetical protein
VRKIDSAGAVTTMYGVLWTTLANPTSAEIIRHADGIGSAARFQYPTGIVAVGNRLILGDLGGAWQPNTPRSATIRAIDLSTGMVSTIAGTVGVFGNADGIRSSPTDVRRGRSSSVS